MRAPMLILLSLVLTISFTCGDLDSENQCADKRYNIYTHFCCSDTLYEKTGFNRCCKGEVIDKRDAFCWMGLSVISFIKNCGEKTYNSQYESCCGDEVMETWSGTKECREGKIVDRE
ncbi:hypothetical protein LSAT2_026095 [Lamellibrachia satsuma]|nr:hypothetical protein LSAT2_026095 [Lamellibrachia satsuma]